MNSPIIEHTPELAEFAKAFLGAQTEFGVAAKEAYNPHFKSDYADFAAYWRACVPPLNRYGILVLQPAAAVPMGTKDYIATMLLHSSGQWIRGYYPIIAAKSDPQSYGAASTYARRFGLAAMLCLIAGDDDGETAMGRGNGGNHEKPAPRNEEQSSGGDARPSEAEEEHRILELIRSGKFGKDSIGSEIDRADLPNLTKDALDLIAEAYRAPSSREIETIAKKVGAKFSDKPGLRDWALNCIKPAFEAADKKGRAA